MACGRGSAAATCLARRLGSSSCCTPAALAAQQLALRRTFGTYGGPVKVRSDLNGAHQELSVEHAARVSARGSALAHGWHACGSAPPGRRRRHRCARGLNCVLMWLRCLRQQLVSGKTSLEGVQRNWPLLATQDGPWAAASAESERKTRSDGCAQCTQTSGGRSQLKLKDAAGPARGDRAAAAGLTPCGSSMLPLILGVLLRRAWLLGMLLSVRLGTREADMQWGAFPNWRAWSALDGLRLPEA